MKRFAGHSKWQNIRHTKAAKDDERAHNIARKLQDIRVVLAGEIHVLNFNFFTYSVWSLLCVLFQEMVGSQM